MWGARKPKVLLKNHPQVQMVVFQHSGHSPYEDMPERFFSVLGEFVASC